MAKGIVRDLRATMARVEDELFNQSRHGSLAQRGLAYEGYAAGYLAALRDVDLALRGVFPNTSRYWLATPDSERER